MHHASPEEDDQVTARTMRRGRGSFELTIHGKLAVQVMATGGCVFHWPEIERLAVEGFADHGMVAEVAMCKALLALRDPPAAAELVQLRSTIDYLRPALLVLRNMCAHAGLSLGRAKADEMLQALRPQATGSETPPAG